MSSLVPKAFCSDCQNLEVNLLSRFEIMDMGTPCSRTISLRYVLVNFSNLSVSLIGRKCADLVNLSTITQMVSSPLAVLGNFVMKSMVIRSHFHSGILVVVINPKAFGIPP